jgi:hypothetical protein
MQGDDAVHDAVRLRELESGVPTRVVAALRRHGCSDDDVLWAALFLLAVLVRDNSTVFSRAKLALVRAGVLPVRPVLWMLVALHSVACTLHAVAVAHQRPVPCCQPGVAAACCAVCSPPHAVPPVRLPIPMCVSVSRCCVLRLQHIAPGTKLAHRNQTR